MRAWRGFARQALHASRLGADPPGDRPGDDVVPRPASRSRRSDDRARLRSARCADPRVRGGPASAHVCSEALIPERDARGVVQRARPIRAGSALLAGQRPRARAGHHPGGRRLDRTLGAPLIGDRRHESRAVRRRCADAVRANRARLRAVLPSEARWLKQVHRVDRRARGRCECAAGGRCCVHHDAGRRGGGDGHGLHAGSAGRRRGTLRRRGARGQARRRVRRRPGDRPRDARCTGCG